MTKKSKRKKGLKKTATRWFRLPRWIRIMTTNFIIGGCFLLEDYLRDGNIELLGSGIKVLLASIIIETGKNVKKFSNS